MVFRLLAGLGAAGVERVLMMPAADGLSPRCTASCAARHTAPGDAPFPVLRGARPRARRDGARTAGAPSRAMRDAGVARDRRARRRRHAPRRGRRLRRRAALRALDRHEQRLPRDARDDRRRARRSVWSRPGGSRRDGAAAPRGALAVDRRARRDLALVDVAVSRERFIGARALWRAARRQRALRHLRRTRAPSACRRSRGAGAARRAAPGAACTCGSRAEARRRAVVTVAARPRPRRAGRRRRAPRRSQLGRAASTSRRRAGTLALDGERELERRPASR